MKKHSHIATACIIFILAVMGCKLTSTEQNTAKQDSPTSVTPTPVTSPQTSASDIPPLDEGIVLRFKVETNGTLKPRVIGETNLPDGTELMVSLDGKSVKYYDVPRNLSQRSRCTIAADPNGGNHAEAAQELHRRTQSQDRVGSDQRPTHGQ